MNGSSVEPVTASEPRATGLGDADTAVAQPAIHQASIAALTWLERLGVAATAAIGHSLGEIAGLVWAGCLPAAEALALVRARGRIMSHTGASGTGMVSVAGDVAGAERLRVGTDLVIAAFNGPGRHVLGGPIRDVRLAAARAAEEGLAATVLPVSHAFHSPAVASCAAEFKEQLDAVTFSPPSRRLISTIRGRPLTADDPVSDLLAEQVVAPVRFSAALDHVLPDTDVFCEAGPGRTVSALTAEASDTPVVSMDVGSPDDRPLAEAAAALFAVGAVAEASALFVGRAARPFDLWRERTFLANPCSQVPDMDVEVSETDDEWGRPDADPPAEAPSFRREPAPVVIELVAAATELDPTAITSEQRLLSDLHLTSLRVAQLVTAAAEATGRQPPIAPLTMADASVGDVIATIETLPARRSDSEEGSIPGVAPWIHGFAEQLREGGDRSPADDLSTWLRLRHPPHHPLRDLAVDAFNSGQAPSTESGYTEAGESEPPRDKEVVEVAYVPDVTAPGAVEALMATVRAATGSGFLAVITHGSALAGFLRTVHLEHPSLGAVLLRVPQAVDGLLAAARYLTGVQLEPGSWRELVVDERGVIRQPVMRPVALSGAEKPSLPLDKSDVLLVSGGGKGIGYSCAAALSRETGVALGLLGRSDPDEDEMLAAHLTQLRDSGARVEYVPADVTDPGAVATAVGQIEEQLGPVTAVLHASGVNEPRRFAELDVAQIHDHLAPKVAGLRSLLAALPADRLTMIVTFGSVIGRYGLPGESHYALANGALRDEVESLADRLPDRRVHHLDWTVWSGTGMGERLDVLDTLLRLDVTPIPVEEGVEWLRRVLTTVDAPTTIAVHGRLGGLTDHSTSDFSGRFLQTPRVHEPDVELVADAHLDPRTDSYLADHRIDGMAVLPAVVGLEAMAQAASVLGGRLLHHARDVRWERPILVPDDARRTVRVCALRRDDAVDVVVRCDETGFRVDHYRALFPLDEPCQHNASPPKISIDGPGLDETEIYGQLCFHTGRFRRVSALTLPSARQCRATIRGADAERWFPPAYAEPMLGCPGVHDATLHALQACVPHRRVLPVGCERFEVNPAHDRGDAWELRAVERSHGHGEYVWDVTALDHAGRVVLSWTGLRLRDVGPLTRSEPWPPSLLGVYLERVAYALGLDSDIRVCVEPGERSWHRGDAPPFTRLEMSTISRSYLDRWMLTVEAGCRVACDWEAATERGEEQWRVLGHAGEVVEQLRVRCREPRHVLATRVWTALESLSKAGRPPSDSLVVAGVFDGGLVLLRSGDATIASTVVSVAGVDAPVAVSILSAAHHGCHRSR